MSTVLFGRCDVSSRVDHDQVISSIVQESADKTDVREEKQTPEEGETPKKAKRKYYVNGSSKK